MIPYADFLYFGVLFYVVVPTFVAGLLGRVSRTWIVATTIAMLAVHYGGARQVTTTLELREISLVGAYAAFEWGVAAAFLRARRRTSARWLFYLSLFLALLPFLIAKYVPVVAPSFQLGFLGISYLTLRCLDVIICTQDRLITTLPVSQFFAYVFFFPTISSGPIDRYRRFDTDWQRARSRAEFLRDADVAVHKLFTGFLYKFIVAALIKRHWLDPAAAAPGLLSLLSYMYAYSFYLFFDFAGYTAFAIGISHLFGVHTPENFDRPFLARNIRDFWNRWHITLSAWLRDHVYMRFVMAATKGRWFARRYLSSYLGLFLAFGLMGLWHGTAIHYLLYGLYHGALLSAHEAFGRWNKQRGIWGDGPVWRAAGVFITFHCVCFGFLLFSGRLIGGADLHATAARYEGQYEKASCDELGGWVWDADHPDTPVRVEVYADGAPVATLTADLPRPDLATIGKGNGAHGFIYVVPSWLKDGVPHTTTVKLAGTDRELGTARQIVCGMHVVALDGYDGSHDVTRCDAIEGWAWDATEPDRTVAVDIYVDTLLRATVKADQPSSTNEGSRNHGFVYPMPTDITDGRLHTITVRISGSNVALKNTPQVVACREGGQAVSQLPATPAPPMPAPTTPATAAVYSDNRDGTISNMTSGLMWEKKVKLDGRRDAADLHDADNCYPWFGACAEGGVECRIDSDCGAKGPCRVDDCQSTATNGLTIFKWVAELNATRFAGYTDWRVPSSEELYSIVNPLEEGDRGTDVAFRGPSCGSDCRDLNDPACSCTHSGLYWAAPQSAPRPDDSWMMFFYCQGNLFLDLKANKFQVRAVRGGAPPGGEPIPKSTPLH